MVVKTRLKVSQNGSEPAAGVKQVRGVVVTPTTTESVAFRIVGTAPLVMHAFGPRAIRAMLDSQTAETQSRRRSKKPPRDFQADFEDARHIAVDGWDGVPCAAFRNALISACRLVGYHMTLAKLSVWVQPDGFERETYYPLVRLHSTDPDEPKSHMTWARNSDGGSDLRCRPMWVPGWSATVRVTWDADQFALTDVANLMVRAGMQVGIGDGRPFSRNSSGQGWGTFRVSET